MNQAPKLELVSADTLPEPPYAASASANGWHPELHIDRIVVSDTWTLAEDDERPWLLRIWFEAWRSVPAGSMPADRRLFARRIGCRAAFLEAHAEVLLRGWRLHADGLLYHAFIASQVVEMLARRRRSAEKVAAWRERKKASYSNADSEIVTGYIGGRNCNVQVSNPQEQDQEQEQEQEEKISTLRAVGGVGENAQPEERASRAKRGTRLLLSDPPADWLDWARAERPDLNPLRTWDLFRDYWAAQPGQKGVKTDWLATWRNWVRRESSNNNRNGGTHGTPGATARRESAVERGERFGAELRARVERHFVDDPGSDPRIVG